MNKLKNLIIEHKRAVIYCRVSSEKQVRDGHGLDSQEKRCIERAGQMDLQIAKIFRDEGVSGKLFERPAMQELIAYLDSHPEESFVIIFDDLKRFARDVEVHLQFRTELRARHAKLICLNFDFQDNPTGRFLETMIASTAQLEREQNAEQVKNKMLVRMQSGYWSFHPPPGLKFIKDPEHGKLLIPDQPYASIYKEAFEKVQNFELVSLEQVQQFILAEYSKRGIDRKLSINGVDRILRRALYAGYMEYEPWGILLAKAKHKGFISFETFVSVQEILDKRKHGKIRKDYSEDFPLRNYVLCSLCNKTLTAAWFRGRRGKLYGKYKCKNKVCTGSSQTIPIDKIHKEFTDLLKKVVPDTGLLTVAEKILEDVLGDKAKNDKARMLAIDREIQKLEAENQSLLDRLLSAKNQTLIGEYEKRIEQNLHKRDQLVKPRAKELSHDSIKTLTGEVFEYIKNPLNQWENTDFRGKRLILNMYFVGKLTYDPDLGFQTPEIPFILKVISGKSESKINMVEMAGVKPASKTDFSQHYSQD